jgi:hypothetical protein
MRNDFRVPLGEPFGSSSRLVALAFVCSGHARVAMA